MIEALLQAERLLVHGMVDQAEQIYASAVEQDPRNAIAMVGLARVALERADDRLAYERAQAALVIDPQNAAAIRLEARLREVLEADQATAPAPEPEPRPSEQAVFTRNPSMADHERMEHERSRQAPIEPSADVQPPDPQPDRRPGLLRRILGG